MGRRGAWPPLRSVPLPGAVGSGGPGRSSTRGSSSGGGRGLAVAGVSASGGAFCGQRWSGRRAWSRGEPVKRLRKTRLLSPSSRLRGAPSRPGSPSRSRVAAAALPSPARLPLRERSRGGPGGERGLQPGAVLPPAGRRRRCAALRAEPPPRRQRAEGCAAWRGDPPAARSPRTEEAETLPQRDTPGLRGGAAPCLRGWAGCLRKLGFFFFLVFFLLFSFWW